jgi:hypothetical protein
LKFAFVDRVGKQLVDLDVHAHFASVGSSRVYVILRAGNFHGVPKVLELVDDCPYFPGKQRQFCAILDFRDL